MFLFYLMNGMMTMFIILMILIMLMKMMGIPSLSVDRQSGDLFDHNSERDQYRECGFMTISEQYYFKNTITVDCISVLLTSVFILYMMYIGFPHLWVNLLVNVFQLFFIYRKYMIIENNHTKKEFDKFTNKITKNKYSIKSRMFRNFLKVVRVNMITAVFTYICIHMHSSTSSRV